MQYACSLPEYYRNISLGQQWSAVSLLLLAAIKCNAHTGAAGLATGQRQQLESCSVFSVSATQRSLWMAAAARRICCCIPAELHPIRKLQDRKKGTVISYLWTPQEVSPLPVSLSFVAFSHMKILVLGRLANLGTGHFMALNKFLTKQ